LACGFAFAEAAAVCHGARIMSNVPNPAPDRWSLQSWFSAFGAADYVEFREALGKELAVPAVLGASLAAEVAAFEALTVRIGHLSAFLGCLSADDAANEAVKRDEAWLATQEAAVAKRRALLQSALAALDDGEFERLLAAPECAGAAHSVRRMREAGRHQMDRAREELAADLNVDGLHAWGRLYDTLTGKMTFPMKFPDGHEETVPMARRRALMAETDRKLREAAFRDGQKPWMEHADTLAAALNGIAGTRLTLYKNRGIGHFLDAPLFDGAVSRATLDAMLGAILEQVDLPRRAIRLAAKRQGTPALAFFDLEAPQVAAPAGGDALSWQQACETVSRAFHGAYPRLGSYFDEMLRSAWIEAQPRPGKRPGAFCTGSLLRKEERVYMTWNGTVHDMVTLAHEAGHAWHSSILRPARPMAADYPMTLAETASNFGEMILLDGLMKGNGVTPETRSWLLDQELLRAHAYLLNIPMRYAFEKSFYEARSQGEVSPGELCRLMEKAQRDLYGDTLLPDGTDPYFWASKMHFFITGVSFYNFPYVFGYLLSQALFARFHEEGSDFLPRYEAFLAMTGSASCEEAAKRTLDADITRKDFWGAAVRAISPILAAAEA
jgi:oligoendopeptidase F